LLISDAIASEGPEFFYSGSMSQDFQVEKSHQVGSSTFPSDEELCLSGSKGRSEFCFRMVDGAMLGQYFREPVSDQRTNKHATNSESTPDKRDLVSVDVHWDFLLAMFAAGFLGVVFGVFIVVLVFKFVLGIPVSFPGTQR
jgi:hypothetical protein